MTTHLCYRFFFFLSSLLFFVHNPLTSPIIIYSARDIMHPTLKSVNPPRLSYTGDNLL